jgi:translation elongation factor EF-4
MVELNWNNINEKSLSRALIFDSVFDPYKWVLAYVKVVDW